jgi:hypothetical protein
MGIAPIAAIGPAIVPAMPVFAPAINPVPATVQAAAVPRAAAPNSIDGAYYLVSGPALPGGAGATRLEQDLMKAALLVSLLDDDDDKDENPLLDLIIAAAVLKMYEQMSAMGTTSSVGFVGDGAGGAVGLSVSVTA